MDWMIKSYADANHPPVPLLSGPDTLTVSSGSQFEIDARGSHDPDGDSLSFYWFVYPEAGSAKEPAVVNQPENANRAIVTAPKVDKPETVHVILRVTDKGTPALTRYKRINVTINP